MSQEIVVQPQGDENPFLRLLERAGQVESFGALFAPLLVQRVVVDPLARRWRIEFTGEPPCGRVELRHLEVALASAIAEVDVVELRFLAGGSVSSSSSPARGVVLGPIGSGSSLPEQETPPAEPDEIDSDVAYMDRILQWAQENGFSNAPQPKPTAAPPMPTYPGRGRAGQGPKPDGVLYGRAFADQPVSISTVTAERDMVVIEGAIFHMDVRTVRGNKEMVSFDLTDRTDSLTAKAFSAPEDELPKRLTEAEWVRVRGPVEVDRFSNELVLMAKDISVGTRPEARKDLASAKRVELHLHTKMSGMDGVCDVKEIFEQAGRWGHKAVAVTDHGVVQAFPDAYEAARKSGVKVIYGVEGYLVDTPNEQAPIYHIVILAKDLVGLKNLYKVVSSSHTHHFYRKPRIPKQVLAELRSGLIIGSACEAGELYRAIVQGEPWPRLKEIASFYDYLEIQPLGNNAFMLEDGTASSPEQLVEWNRAIVRLANEMGLPIIATGDVHFLKPEDDIYRKILMAGQGFGDVERQAPLYFRTTDEMLGEFAYLDEGTARRCVVDDPNAIANQVDEFPPRPEKLHAFTIPDGDGLVERAARQKARELYGYPLPEIVETRLDKELTSIIGNGFSSLYWAAHLLVKKSVEDGYLVGSRGSVGSSLVATLLEITEVNPLPPHYLCMGCHISEFFDDGRVGAGVDLPDKACSGCSRDFQKLGFDIAFEVFLGFKGDKVPDIDLNFSGEYQSKIHRYTEELFGKENIFRAGTIATLADRTAFGYVKKYLDERGRTARNAEVNRLVKGVAGVRRTTGQHPGGLLVVPAGVEIYDFTPIQHPANDRDSDVVTTHFDFHAIHDQLVKLDLLGHDDPTVLRVLHDMTGIDPTTIPLDDPETTRLFFEVEVLALTPEVAGTTVGTVAIPEFGTSFVRQMLEDTRPKTFGELVRIQGFSHGTDVWLNNAQELIRRGTAKVTEAIATRDDIMLYLIRKGIESSRAFRIMEQVRKGKGVTVEDRALMKEHSVPDWYIDSCDKISYLFPKAHAAAYAIMGFRIAYFKVHHPQAFYAAYFSVRAEGDFDADLVCKGPTAIREHLRGIQSKGNEATAKDLSVATVLEVALEAMARGVHLLRVHLYDSDVRRFRVTPEGLLPPLIALQGLGISAAESIEAARAEKPFMSVDDLRGRARVSKTVIDILRQHGCLEGLPETDQMSLF